MRLNYQVMPSCTLARSCLLRRIASSHEDMESTNAIRSNLALCSTERKSDFGPSTNYGSLDKS